MRVSTRLLASLAVSAGGASAAPEAADKWTVLPINGGGYVQHVQIAPSNPKVWYTYVDVGGPYRSDDAGATWRPLHGNMNQNQRNVWADHIRTLLVDPRDEDRIVFAAGWHTDRLPAGLYVSKDGGRSFRRTVKASFHGEGSRKWAGKVIRRDPANPDRLVAASDANGLYLSEDGGESWTPVGGDNAWFDEVWFDLAVSGRVYAAAPEPPEGQQRKSGLVASADGGRRWKLLSREAPFEMAQMPGRRELYGIFNPNGAHEIRVSRDGGATWTAATNGLPRRTEGYGLRDYLALAAGPDFLLTASFDGRMYRLQAGSSDWREIPVEKLVLSHPGKETAYERDIDAKSRPATADIVIDPRDPRHVLTTDWFNVWESFDGCRTWRTRLNGVQQLVPFTVACDPHSPDNISYGCADMGMFNSQDGGRTYRKEHAICGANSIAFAHRTPHRAYAVGGKVGIQLIISEDGGKTWRYSKYAGLPPLGQKDGRHGIYTVAVDPLTDDVFVCVSGRIEAGKGGVYRSTDGGDTWSWFSRGMDAFDAYYKESEFSWGGPALWPDQLVFGPDGSAVTYGPATGKTYWLDREKGEWRAAAAWNKGGRFTLAADPHVPGRFLLCEQGRIVELTEGGSKVNWQLAGSEGLGHAIAFDPFTPGLVVASTADSEDICVSRDGGRHWTCLDGGMDVPTGTQHKLVLDRRRLFVLTRGSGVWVRTLEVRGR